MGYSYTLSGAIDHSDAVADSDSFAVVVTDVDGDSDSSTLTIDIANDGPTADDDGNSIAAGAYGPVSGNVVTNDVEGADTAEVTAVTGTVTTGSGDFNVDGASTASWR